VLESAYLRGDREGLADRERRDWSVRLLDALRRRGGTCRVEKRCQHQSAFHERARCGRACNNATGIKSVSIMPVLAAVLFAAALSTRLRSFRIRRRVVFS